MKPKSNLQLLSELYKLDLNHFMSSELNGSNFLENYSIFKEMLPIIVENADKNDRAGIEKNSDRILQFCVEKLIESNNEQSQVVLNYIKDCSSLASSRMTQKLFVVYLHYFIQMSSLKGNVHFTIPHFVAKLFENESSALFQLNDFDDEKIDFLNSFFSMISRKSKFFELVDIELIEFLVNAAHQVLYEVEHNLSLTKLAINCLCKIGSSGESFRKLVLSKTFSNLKNAVFNENYFEIDASLQQKMPKVEKKRLESFFEDKNLNLVTSLADFFLDKEKQEMGFLEQSELWYLVQVGLVHTNALTRKRALYLLKRTCDLAAQSSGNINSRLVDFYGEEKVFLFDASSPVWNDFFLCVELLEETSVHIIKPSLSKVNAIIDAIQAKKFHFSWLLVLLERAFLHESKFIVRWAVATFLQAKIHTMLENCSHLETQLRTIRILSRFFFGPFILIAQKPYLYYKADDNVFIDNCPKIAIQLSDFLRSFVHVLPSDEFKIKFLEEFTHDLGEYTWSATCLLFICKAFFELDADSTNNLSTEICKNISKIINWSLRTQEILLRSAIQTLLFQSLMKHVKPSDLNEGSLKDFTDSMNCFSMRECLTYGNSTWMKLVEWFKLSAQTQKGAELISAYLNAELNKLLTGQSLDEFTVNNLCSKIAKLILILSDAGQTECLKKCIDTIVEKLANCNKYIYMSQEVLENCLEIFSLMLAYLNNSKFNEWSKPSFKTVLGIYVQAGSELLDFILRKFSDECEKIEPAKMRKYLDAAENIFEFRNESCDQLKMARSKIKDKVSKTLIPAIVAFLRNTQMPKKLSSEWKRFLFLNVFVSFINCGYEKEVALSLAANSDFVQEFFFNTDIVTKEHLTKLDKDVPFATINFIFENYSIFIGEYLKKYWNVYDFLVRETFLREKLNSDPALATRVLHKYESVLDLTTYTCLPQVIKFFSHLLSLSVNREEDYLRKLGEISTHLFKLVWELRVDTRSFGESYAALTQCLFNSDVFRHNSENPLTNAIISLSKELIEKGEEKPSVVKPLMEATLRLLTPLDSQVNQRFIALLIDFLVFGDVYKKDKKHLKEIEICVESLGEEFGTNQLVAAEYLYDSNIRISTLFYLLKSNNLDEAFFEKLTQKIVDKDQSFLEGNKKVFINSLIHRERFRLWQFVLTILPRLNNNSLENFEKYAEKNLVTETQPSIRILNEWILIKIISWKIKNIKINTLLDKLKDISFKKVGYTCSWLSILTHLVPIIPEEHQVDFFTNLVPMILSQILSSNFHIRTFVEATLIKLRSILTDSPAFAASFLGNVRVQSLIDQVFSIIKPAIENKERHANIVLKQFYFQFDPIQDYSIDAIFNLCPSLSGMAEDEIVSLEAFLSLVLKKRLFEVKPGDYEFEITPRLKNAGSKLYECAPGLWRFTAYKDESLFEANVSIEDLQKKIIPWHCLMPRQEDLESLTKSKQVEDAGLILVGSLIDKGTNLGGICRTCEIFNVKELTVNSIKLVEDKTFQQLSVTAEKWLNIKEVHLKHLKTYLMEMKCAGYTLIGLEQTANSVQLNEYVFPKKSLLVLGNEKEGIPVDFIQLLDVCLEIPQLGVVRSLNVHVSAAIAIWEFTKQRLATH